MISDADLHAYLDEASDPARVAAIEGALRDDAALRERLGALVAGRDAGLHSLGEVWRRSRLTCPPREQLGSHLLGVLPEGLADYVTFHLEVISCPWCRASVDDLQERHAQGASADAPRRRSKYFASSVGRLK